MTIKQMMDLYKKHKEKILYLFFGGVTTMVNIGCYWCTTRLLHIEEMPSTWIAWVAGVLVAYVTNKIWVFESKARGFKDFLKEVTSFVAFRVLTGAMDFGIMFIFVEKLHFHDLVMKTLSNVLVIIGNYIASKLVIFKKKTVME